MKESYDILVIDDELVVIDSVIKIGEINNYSVDHASEAVSAFEKIENTNYRLIICDIMLPGMDGFQILQELQKRKIETPVIMTTGYSSLENAVKSLYLGAIDFVPKPFTFDEITNVIKRGFNYSRLLKSIENDKTQITFVPCPHKYFRLGNSCWANSENDGSVSVGATDLYLKTIDNISKIELLDVGETVNQASPLAKIETSDSSIHILFSAISGRIIDRNENLIIDISILEKDPYFNGWIYKLIPSELEYEITLLTSCSSDR